jgi:hypothetical protein
MKNPAVLFYTGDFLSGTLLFTDEQVGQYIKLLCAQHQLYPNFIPESYVLTICKTLDSPVVKKFLKTTLGYYNDRMRIEIERRNNFCTSRSLNRLNKRLKTEVKTKPEKKESTKKYNVEILDFYNKKGIGFDFIGADYLPAFSEFLEYKKREFNDTYKSQKTVVIAFEKFKEYCGTAENSSEYLKSIIANRWRGLFPIKSQKKDFRNKSDFD